MQYTFETKAEKLKLKSNNKTKHTVKKVKIRVEDGSFFSSMNLDFTTFSSFF